VPDGSSRDGRRKGFTETDCARRLARTARLPRINTTVDCYNLVSVSHDVPAGAFGPAVDAAAADLAARAATRSRRVSTHWLTPAWPAAALGDSTA